MKAFSATLFVYKTFGNTVWVVNLHHTTTMELHSFEYFTIGGMSFDKHVKTIPYINHCFYIFTHLNIAVKHSKWWLLTYTYGQMWGIPKAEMFLMCNLI